MGKHRKLQQDAIDTAITNVIENNNNMNIEDQIIFEHDETPPHYAIHK